MIQCTIPINSNTQQCSQDMVLTSTAPPLPAPQSDLRLVCVPVERDSKIKIGLTRGLVEGGDIFAQFNLSNRAEFNDLIVYIGRMLPKEQILAIYWYSPVDKEFTLIHDSPTLKYCLSHCGLHEIFYLITELKPELVNGHSVLDHMSKSLINGKFKTSSPDTLNTRVSSDEYDDKIPVSELDRKKMNSATGSLEWSYEPQAACLQGLLSQLYRRAQLI